MVLSMVLLVAAAAVLWMGRSSMDPVAMIIPRLKALEGFRSDRYWDYHQYSIGYGSRWEPGMSLVISEPEASVLLEQRLRGEYLPSVEARGRGLRVHEKAALLSAVYNLGPGCLAGGTWFDRYLAGDMSEARHRFLMWINAGGSPSDSLLARRKREWYLLRTGTWNEAAGTMAEAVLPL